jgi:DNA polymerase III subunit beta
MEKVVKANLERNLLVKSLARMSRIVERRNTVPILSNVLLRASDGALHLKATDIDLEVTETIPADVEVSGATTVPAQMLSDIARKLPDGANVSLDGTKDQFLIRSGRSRITLQSLPEADFPDMATGELSHKFTIAASDLTTLFGKTEFAISTEETRFYLNGVFLHTVTIDGQDKLRAVATDGHRLGRIEIPAPEGSHGMPGVIVPRKAVAEVQRLVDDRSGVVGIEVSGTKIRFTIGAVVLTSKLIDGTFPDYERVIPTRNEKRLVVDREAFAKAVDRVSTVSSERTRAVKLSIAEGRLTLSVNSAEAGSAVEELDVDYTDVAMDVGFNSRYLMDLLGELDGDEARFDLADSGSPAIVKDHGNPDALYVLMPMRA